MLPPRASAVKTRQHRLPASRGAVVADQHLRSVHTSKVTPLEGVEHGDRSAQVDVGAGPLADAQWVKHRVGLATQALPNGYCGLPIQRTCPHANACLTCPVFVTTPDFLKQHHQHREQTRRLLESATATGQLRLAEMNQRVLDSLDRIIPALEAGQDPQTTLDEGEAAGAR